MAFFTAGFGIWRTSDWWRGERDPVAATPVMCLLRVAGSIVTGTACLGTSEPAHEPPLDGGRGEG